MASTGGADAWLPEEVAKRSKAVADAQMESFQSTLTEGFESDVRYMMQELPHLWDIQTPSGLQAAQLLVKKNFHGALGDLLKMDKANISQVFLGSLLTTAVAQNLDQCCQVLVSEMARQVRSEQDRAGAGSQALQWALEQQLNNARLVKSGAVVTPLRDAWLACAGADGPITYTLQRAQEGDCWTVWHLLRDPCPEGHAGFLEEVRRRWGVQRYPGIGDEEWGLMESMLRNPLQARSVVVKDCEERDEQPRMWYHRPALKLYNTGYTPEELGRLQREIDQIPEDRDVADLEFLQEAAAAGNLALLQAVDLLQPEILDELGEPKLLRLLERASGDAKVWLAERAVEQGSGYQSLDLGRAQLDMSIASLVKRLSTEEEELCFIKCLGNRIQDVARLVKRDPAILILLAEGALAYLKKLGVETGAAAATEGGAAGVQNANWPAPFGTAALVGLATAVATSLPTTPVLVAMAAFAVRVGLDPIFAVEAAAAGTLVARFLNRPVPSLGDLILRIVDLLPETAEAFALVKAILDSAKQLASTMAAGKRWPNSGFASKAQRTGEVAILAVRLEQCAADLLEAKNPSALTEGWRPRFLGLRQDDSFQPAKGAQAVLNEAARRKADRGREMAYERAAARKLELAPPVASPEEMLGEFPASASEQLFSGESTRRGTSASGTGKGPGDLRPSSPESRPPIEAADQLAKVPGGAVPQEIFFVTGRKPGRTPGSFGRGRAAALSYGRIRFLAEPPAEGASAEAVPRPRSWRAWFLEWRAWYLAWIDDDQRSEGPGRIDVEVMESKEDFFEAVIAAERACIEAGAGTKDPLVYTHGYNTTFKGAVWDVRSFQKDLQRQGPVILFSWPSFARLLWYPGDRRRAVAATAQLEGLLTDLSAERTHSFAELGNHRPLKVLSVAHSLGNEPVTRALESIGRRERANGPPLASPDFSRLRFLPALASGEGQHQFVFLQADVPAEVFVVRMASVRFLGNCTLGFASDDWALTVAWAIPGYFCYPRAGGGWDSAFYKRDPLVCRGGLPGSPIPELRQRHFATLNCTGHPGGFLGHTYHLIPADVSQAIRRLLSGASPLEKTMLAPVHPFWLPCDGPRTTWDWFSRFLRGRRSAVCYIF